MSDPDPAQSAQSVVVHTDGACSGNPGPGGWGAILQWGDHTRELKGGEAHTTNNRMELMAPIQGLLALREPCEVEITTDAEYVRQGMTLWILSWKRRRWWKKNRPVRNAELWIELDELAAQHMTIYVVGGVLLLGLAIYLLLGGQIHLPMPGQRAGGKAGIKSLK